MPRPVRRSTKAPAKMPAKVPAKVIVLLTFLVLILGACSSDGFPTSYTDQTDPDTGVSNVEQNWIDGCTVGLGESDLAEDANRVCECSFAVISADVSDGGIPFEDFVAIDSDLSSNPDTLNNSETLTATEQRLVDIVKGCIAGG